MSFAVCVRNDGYAASLELRKLYPALRDRFAEEHGFIRVVDESGDDYLYPADYFVRLDVPVGVKHKLRKIVRYADSRPYRFRTHSVPQRDARELQRDAPPLRPARRAQSQ